jgi:hypothetical protein
MNPPSLTVLAASVLSACAALAAEPSPPAGPENLPIPPAPAVPVAAPETPIPPPLFDSAPLTLRDTGRPTAKPAFPPAPRPLSATTTSTNASLGTAASPAGSEAPPPAEVAALRDGARIPGEPTAEPSAFPAPSSIGGTVLSMDDPFLGSLPPFRQREVERFAESLPRYLADPAEDGFAAQAGTVLFPEPVELELGQVRIGGGLVTAIRQRNPFALLNILDVFHLSW